MNTHLHRGSLAVIAVLVLLGTACTPSVTVGAEQTFAVDVPQTVTGDPTAIALEFGAGKGTLALAGGAEGLLQGGITYNAPEYEPALTASDGVLLIHQAGPTSTFLNINASVLNRWNLQLGETSGIVTVRTETGNYTLEFADTLPADLAVDVTAGVGNVRLVLAPALSARVTLGELTRVDVATQGDWTQAGDVYTTGSGPVAVAISISMSIGSLTLENR